MTVSVQMLNDSIKAISESNTLLDMLLEFEKTLDNLDLYAFKNWQKGEILEGPTLNRHFVNVKLIYPKADMPDPEGAKRLMARDCLVKYTKENLLRPRKVRTYADVTAEARKDGRTVYRPKSESSPVWVVSIDMPRRYVDEFNKDVVEIDADKLVDLEDTNMDAGQDAATINNTVPGVI
jgi:hypothetical protein